ncbi:MAG TPA: DUF6152 family protein [Gammaproteobacteria bacterium]|nr:DUF6152 family protein [Gammaproteobacteria bacterium]
MTTLRNALAAAAAISVALAASTVAAHHSYAMFDGTRTVTVKGTVAKVEWVNPHVFIWVYVPNAAAQSGYDLYAFENGSTNVLMRRGWTRDTLAAGEELTVEYWPLTDGRAGGHFRAATHADGTITRGAGGPAGVDGAGGAGATVPAARPQ